jgi:NAD+ kinase
MTMPRQQQVLEPIPTATRPACIGMVVHPTRPLAAALSELREWAGERNVDLVQLPSFPGEQRVAVEGSPGDCDLIVAIGGDGTTLAAIRAGIDAERPVLILRDVEDPLLAVNDLVIVRNGEGQVRVNAHVDGTLFARFSGDGCIVSTPLGSSAYALSAGGPLLAPDTQTFVLTPLTVHGGTCPPLVLAAGSRLTLDVKTGYGGARIELDGQVADNRVARLTIGLRPAVTTIVGFDDQEPFIAGLRRRGVIADSPRIVAEDGRG